MTGSDRSGPATLDDLLAVGIRGRHVLVRCDLNVPLEDSGGTVQIGDDSRITASAVTLGRLVAAGARIVVVAHLGRPKGAPDPALSLRPVAERLAAILGRPVHCAQDTVGHSAQSLATNLGDGELLVLENVRFEAAETATDPQLRANLASALAALADPNGGFVGYVDDAFGAVHRAHASVLEIASLLPNYAGDLVVREVGQLDRLAGQGGEIARPYAVVLGGSKVADKIGVIERLLPQVDHLLVGGGMCYTFLTAMGYEVGTSLLEPSLVQTCRELLARAGQKIVLPRDLVVADRIAPDAVTSIVAADRIAPGTMGLDIGPATRAVFAELLSRAGTVFWNGPMGVFELEPFAAGTKAVATAIAGADAFTVVGGGDSAAAIHAFGFDPDRFSHISTGGGASLEYLEGRVLPGLSVLAGPIHAVD